MGKAHTICLLDVTVMQPFQAQLKAMERLSLRRYRNRPRPMGEVSVVMLYCYAQDVEETCNT